MWIPRLTCKPEPRPLGLPSTPCGTLVDAKLILLNHRQVPNMAARGIHSLSGPQPWLLAPPSPSSRPLFIEEKPWLLDLLARKGALYLEDGIATIMTALLGGATTSSNLPYRAFSGHGNWAQVWQMGEAGEQELCPSLPACVIGRGGLTSLVLSFCHQ